MTLLDAVTGRRVDAMPPGAIRAGRGGNGRFLVGPALFDPQVNGFAGVDFQDPDLSREGLEYAASEIRKAGCSHFLLAVISAPSGFLAEQLRRIAGILRGSLRLRRAIPGIHLEGPYLSASPGYAPVRVPDPRRPGRPEAQFHAPDWREFSRFQRASGGRIRIVTLAPEWRGSAGFIRKAAASGVVVSLGHTGAALPDLRAAVEAGATLFTHLGNGCPAQLHRHENIIWRVLSIPRLRATLIPDGIHLPPIVLSALARALGPERLLFTTDCVTPAGAPPGRYRVGGIEVEVGGDRVVMAPGGKSFAGSGLTPLEGLRNAVRFGAVSVGLAWRAWTRLRDEMFPTLRPPALIVPQ